MVRQDFNLRGYGYNHVYIWYDRKPKGVSKLSVTIGGVQWVSIKFRIARRMIAWYCAVPIFHISGLSILMQNVIYGMKVVLAGKI